MRLIPVSFYVIGFVATRLHFRPIERLYRHHSQITQHTQIAMMLAVKHPASRHGYHPNPLRKPLDIVSRSRGRPISMEPNPTSKALGNDGGTAIICLLARDLGRNSTARRVNVDNPPLANPKRYAGRTPARKPGLDRVSFVSGFGYFHLHPCHSSAPSEEAQSVKLFPAHVMDEAIAVKHGVGGKRLPGY